MWSRPYWVHMVMLMVDLFRMYSSWLFYVAVPEFYDNCHVMTLFEMTDLSHCSHELLWIWVTYGVHWSCASGSHWTGGTPSPLRDIQRVDNHNNWRRPSWHSSIPQSCIRATRHRDGMLAAKAQSHPSDSYARWERGPGRGPGPGPPERQRCVLFYYRTELYKKQSHNRRMDNSNTRTSSDHWNEALCENGAHRQLVPVKHTHKHTQPESSSQPANFETFLFLWSILCTTSAQSS